MFFIGLQNDFKAYSKANTILPQLFQAETENIFFVSAFSHNLVEKQGIKNAFWYDNIEVEMFHRVQPWHEDETNVSSFNKNTWCQLQAAQEEPRHSCIARWCGMYVLNWNSVDKRWGAAAALLASYRSFCLLLHLPTYLRMLKCTSLAGSRRKGMPFV